MASWQEDETRPKQLRTDTKMVVTRVKMNLCRELLIQVSVTDGHAEGRVRLVMSRA